MIAQHRTAQKQERRAAPERPAAATAGASPRVAGQVAHRSHTEQGFDLLGCRLARVVAERAAVGDGAGAAGSGLLGLKAPPMSFTGRIQRMMAPAPVIPAPPVVAVPVPPAPLVHALPSPNLTAYANGLRGANQATTPRVACEFTLANGNVFLGHSGPGHVVPPALQPYFNVNIPNAAHHPGCAESDCLIQAVNAHGLAAVVGGTYNSVRVRPAASLGPGHGIHICPCPGCQQVASTLNIAFT